jgi:hypothetical protein
MAKSLSEEPFEHRSERLRVDQVCLAAADRDDCKHCILLLHREAGGRERMRRVRWRRWGLVLVVLAALGGLSVAGRLLDIPEDRRSVARPAASTAPLQPVSDGTLPPPVIPEALRRPLRLPSLRRDGSCPATPAAGPPMPRANPAAAVALGDGPVYPVLFRNADGRLDRSVVVYWDAPKPLGGVVIVRGHRLGAARDPIRFQNDRQELRLIHVLDPARAHPAGGEGLWWRTTLLRVGAGCYGLQIDGPRFSQVLVVEFR